MKKTNSNNAIKKVILIALFITITFSITLLGVLRTPEESFDSKLAKAESFSVTSSDESVTLSNLRYASVDKGKPYVADLNNDDWLDEFISSFTMDMSYNYTTSLITKKEKYWSVVEYDTLDQATEQQRYNSSSGNYRYYTGDGMTQLEETLKYTNRYRKEGKELVKIENDENTDINLTDELVISVGNNGTLMNAHTIGTSWDKGANTPATYLESYGFDFYCTTCGQKVSPDNMNFHPFDENKDEIALEEINYFLANPSTPSTHEGCGGTIWSQEKIVDYIKDSSSPTLKYMMEEFYNPWTSDGLQNVSVPTFATLNARLNLSINYITISGTTWRGEPADIIIYSNGQSHIENVLAGIYHVSEIAFTIDFSIPYFSEFSYYQLQYRQPKEDEEERKEFYKAENDEDKDKYSESAYTTSCNSSYTCETKSVTNSSFSENSLKYEPGESDFGLVLISNLTFNSSTGSLYSDNFNLTNIEYNGTDYQNKIKLSGEVSQGEFSFSSQSKNLFNIGKGIIDGSSHDGSNLETLADDTGLELVWFKSDSVFGTELDEVKDAGEYYLTILPINRNTFTWGKVEDNDSSSGNISSEDYSYAYSLLNVTTSYAGHFALQTDVPGYGEVSSSNPMRVFTKKFTISKRKLNIDLVNEVGGKIDSTSVEYNKLNYDFSHFFSAVPTEDSALGCISIEEWGRMNGIESDYDYITDAYLKFNGTGFVDGEDDQNKPIYGNEIGAYAYINMFVSFDDSHIYTNYEPVLGEYSDLGVFAGYATNGTGTPGDSENTTIRYKVDTESSPIVYQYRFYLPNGKKFYIYKPSLKLEVSDGFQTDYVYGDLFDTTEIDTSYFSISGAGAYDSVKREYAYDDGWKIKIINSESSVVRKTDTGDFATVSDTVGKKTVYIVVRTYASYDYILEEQKIPQSNYYVNANDKYYIEYNDILYASCSLSSDGIYSISFSMFLVDAEGNVKTGIWNEGFIAASPDKTISGANSKEERRNESFISFEMNLPIKTISISKRDLYFNITDIAPNKYYDGTDAVYAPVYKLAVGGNSIVGCDYVYNDSTSNVIYNGKKFYKYDSNTLSYYLSTDATFSKLTNYYLKTDSMEYENRASIQPMTSPHSKTFLKISDTSSTLNSILEYDIYYNLSTVATLGYLDYNCNYVNGELSTCVIELKKVPTAGWETDKVIDSFFAPKGGANAKYALDSYSVQSELYIGGEKQRDVKGYIYPLPLDTVFLENPDYVTDITNIYYTESDYMRSYQETTGVAIRVAKYDDEDENNNTVMGIFESKYPEVQVPAGKEYYADYYFAYYVTKDSKKVELGYYFYYELMQGTYINKKDGFPDAPITFVYMEILGGFLETYNIHEGFNWVEYWGGEDAFNTSTWVVADNFKDFLYNKTNGATESFFATNKASDLIYWYDNTYANALAKRNKLAEEDLSAVNYYSSVCALNDQDKVIPYRLNLDYSAIIRNYYITSNDKREGAMLLTATQSYYISLATSKVCVDGTVYTISSGKIKLGESEVGVIDTVEKFFILNGTKYYYDSDGHLYQNKISITFEIARKAVPETIYQTFIDKSESMYIVDGVVKDKKHIYDSETHADSIFISDTYLTYVNISKHPEYDEILSTYPNGNFNKLDGEGNRNIVVKSYSYVNNEGITITATYRDENGRLVPTTYKNQYGGTVYVDQNFDEDVLGLKRAGSYELLVTIPQTPSYRPVNNLLLHFTIHKASVGVYSSVASRTYMVEYSASKEVSFDGYTKILLSSEEELENYIAYIDANTGSVYAKDNVPSSVSATYMVYAYYDQNGVMDATKKCIFFVGFLNEEFFSDGELLPEVKNTYIYSNYASYGSNGYTPVDRLDYEDKVGNYPCIYTGGAYARNYEFNYFYNQDLSTVNANCCLFVFARSVELDIDASQDKNYNGSEDILPTYDIYYIEDGVRRYVNSSDASISKSIVGYYYIDDDGKTVLLVSDSTIPAGRREAVFSTNFGDESDTENIDAYYYYYDQNEQVVYLYVSQSTYLHTNSVVGHVNTSEKMTVNSIVYCYGRNGEVYEYLGEFDLGNGKFVLQGKEYEFLIENASYYKNDVYGKVDIISAIMGRVYFSDNRVVVDGAQYLMQVAQNGTYDLLRNYGVLNEREKTFKFADTVYYFDNSGFVYSNSSRLEEMRLTNCYLDLSSKVLEINSNQYILLTDNKLTNEGVYYKTGELGEGDFTLKDIVLYYYVNEDDVADQNNGKLYWKYDESNDMYYFVESSSYPYQGDTNKLLLGGIEYDIVFSDTVFIRKDSSSIGKIDIDNHTIELYDYTFYPSPVTGKVYFDNSFMYDAGGKYNDVNGQIKFADVTYYFTPLTDMILDRNIYRKAGSIEPNKSRITIGNSSYYYTEGENVLYLNEAKTSKYNGASMDFSTFTVLLGETTYYFYGKTYTIYKKDGELIQNKNSIEILGKKYKINNNYDVIGVTGTIEISLCSDYSELENEDASLRVEYCDCNVFGTVLQNDGTLPGSLSVHKEDAQMENTIRDYFDTLGQNYYRFISQFSITNSAQTWNLTNADASYSAYQSLLGDAELLFDSSNLDITKNLSYTESSGMLLGLNKPYMMTFGASNVPSYNDMLTIVARLLGYSSVSSLTTNIGSLVSKYLNTISERGNDIDDLEWDGAFYTEYIGEETPNSESIVFPFAFVNASYADPVIGFIFIQRSGNTAIWLSDILDAQSVANYNNILSLTDYAELTVYGRCVLFDSHKVYHFDETNDIMDETIVPYQKKGEIDVYNYSFTLNGVDYIWTNDHSLHRVLGEIDFDNRTFAVQSVSYAYDEYGQIHALTAPLGNYYAFENRVRINGVDYYIDKDDKVYQVGGELFFDENRFVINTSTYYYNDNGVYSNIGCSSPVSGATINKSQGQLTISGITYYFQTAKYYYYEEEFIGSVTNTTVTVEGYTYYVKDDALYLDKKYLQPLGTDSYIDGDTYSVVLRGVTYYYRGSSLYFLKRRLFIDKNIELSFNNFGYDDVAKESLNYIDTVHDADNNEVKIYLGMNQPMNSPTITNEVWYYDDDHIGYYLLSVKPLISGKKSNNFTSNSQTLISFRINILEIETILDNIHIEKAYDGETYGTSNDIAFNNFFIGSDGTTTVKFDWGTTSIIGYYYHSCYDEAVAFSSVDYYQFGTAYNDMSGDFANESDNYWGAYSAYVENCFKNAGIYVIFIKANIVDSLSKNIGFASVPNVTFANQIGEKTNSRGEIYFVVYLSRTRCNSITAMISAEGMKTEQDKSGLGLDGVLSKTYDNVDVRYGLVITNNASGNIKDDVLAFSATVSQYSGFDTAYAYIAETSNLKDADYVFNPTNAFDMNDCGLNGGYAFYIEFVINGGAELNNNYERIVKRYAVRIDKKVIDVSLSVKDGKTSDKTYGQRNAEVEGNFRFDFVVSGVAHEAGNAHYLSSGIVLYGEMTTTITDEFLPRIDWSNVVGDQKASVGSDYEIGVLPNENMPSLKNYEFVFEKTLSFSVKKATPSKVTITSQSEYSGEKQTPSIIRLGVNGGNLDVDEANNEDYNNGIDKLGTGVDMYGNPTDYSISCVGKFDASQGQYTYKLKSGLILHKIPETGLAYADIADKINGEKDCNFGTVFEPVLHARDVGIYLFEVSFKATTNYLGLDRTYFIFEITKAQLVMSFVTGIAEKVYDGQDNNYPGFAVEYKGLKESIQIGTQYISYFGQAEEYTGVSDLGLINPLYWFVDKDGNRLSYSPKNVMSNDNEGFYYISVLIDTANEQYGVAYNYYITVSDTIVPKMYITPRPVKVGYEETCTKVSKAYDGTTKVTQGSVPNTAYVFQKITGNKDSGILKGDTLILNINYNHNGTKFERKDVYIEDPVSGQLISEMKVRVYVEDVDSLQGENAKNYELHWDSSEHYIDLKGYINPASATVLFYEDTEMTTLVKSKLVYAYNGQAQGVTFVIYGVSMQGGGYEAVECTSRYYSEVTTYDKVEPPKNCAEYVFEVVVKNDTIEQKNYLEQAFTLTLIIEKASVDISFGGDPTQTYGDVTGVSAYAKGAGDFYLALNSEITYYKKYQKKEVVSGGRTIYEDDLVNGFSEMVTDITTADIGVYYARVYFKEATNFGEKYAYEEFEIVAREVSYSYQIAPTYTYTGLETSMKLYITFNNTEFVPQLLFDMYKNGEYVPYNYSMSGNTIKSVNNIAPKNVGKYRVTPYSEGMKNFIITNPESFEFEITKANLIIKVNDATIDTKTTYSPEFTLIGAQNGETSSAVLGGDVKLKYFDAVSGKQLNGAPKEAGTYTVIAYDISLGNYNVEYQAGTLIINNREMKIEVNSDSSEVETQIVIDGSFGIDTKITVSYKQNVDYSDESRAFKSYIETNTQFAGYTLGALYVFEFEKFSYSGNEEEGLNIKLYLPDLLKQTENVNKSAYAAEEDQEYYIAVFYDEGVEIVPAEVNGDYISFKTKSVQVRAISVLEKDAEEEESNLDWLWYLFAGLGVVIIGLAILLVTKKKGA